MRYDTPIEQYEALLSLLLVDCTSRCFRASSSFANTTELVSTRSKSASRPFRYNSLMTFDILTRPTTSCFSLNFSTSYCCRPYHSASVLHFHQHDRMFTPWIDRSNFLACSRHTNDTATQGETHQEHRRTLHWREANDIAFYELLRLEPSIID